MWQCPKCGRNFKNEEQAHYCGKIETIDQYISEQVEEVQPILNKIRQVMRESAPDSIEKISWQMPTFWQNENLVHFAAFKKHIGIYPGGEATGVFADKLSGYKTSKGAIQMPLNKPIPYDLIEEITRWRVSRVERKEFTVRRENPDDYESILRLTYEAFKTLDYPGRRRVDEHYLIHLLRDSANCIPELCFVAEHNGQITGHILYTKSEFQRRDGSVAETITFGPLSVLPKFHRLGIGRALVTHSIEKAREMGFGAVLILGVPDYYPKLGFRRAAEFGLTLADNSSPDAFMAYELIEGYLQSGGTGYRYAPEYDMAENDDAGFEEFEKNFDRCNRQRKKTKV